MDNNQPNPWQSAQNPSQPAPSTWGGATNATTNFGQSPTATPESQSAQPTPPSYQPPVSYGAIDGVSAGAGQSTPASQPASFGGAGFNQAAPTAPNSASVSTNPTQPATSSAPFASTAPSAPAQPTPMSGANPIPGVTPTQPVGAPGQAAPTTPAQPTAKPKQPLSQNHILFMVTGLVSVVALAVIVICVVLVVSK